MLSTMGTRRVHFGSDGVTGIAPRDPSTPPDVRFSASGGWRAGNSYLNGLKRILPGPGVTEPWIPPRPQPCGGHGRSNFARCPAVSTDYATCSHPLASLPPSALRSFRRYAVIFTTTASADFSHALTREISPGKVHELSARAVRLYPMRLSVTVGFCVSSHAHLPHRCLSACSFSYGRAFASTFFRAEHLAMPALVLATVVVTSSGHFVSSD